MFAKRFIVVVFSWVLVAHLLEETSQSPLQQVVIDLTEHRISDSNDTAYVNEIMRFAKSAEMRTYMNDEFEPCEDFYEYSCGNWGKINPADHKKQMTTIIDLLSRTYNQKQLKFLKEGPQENDTSIERKVKDFFGACVSRGGIPNKQRYKMKLREIISEFGEMPALVRNEIWEAREKFDWIATIAKIQHKYGLDIVLQLGIRRDFNSSSSNKLFVGPPSLQLGTKTMYFNEETETYRNLYKDALKKDLKFYLDLSEEKASTVALEIFNFEKQLAEGLTDHRSGLSMKDLSIARTLKEVARAYPPSFNISKYIQLSLGHEFNETFYEFANDYQKNLVQVIQKTPEKQLANYIFFQLIRVFFFNIEYSKVKRQSVCLDKTKILFPQILDKVMYQRYNNEKTSADVNLIWTKIKETFRQELESEKLTWMSLMTRKIALEKLEIIKLEINSYEQENFTQEFQDLNIRKNDFIYNIKSVLSFQTLKSIEKLNKVPKVDAGFDLSNTPAFVPTENVIKIPIKLLQPNYLWSDYYPNALKFGSLGYLIAHELLHGFDDLGRYVDAQGNDNAWWDEATTKAFNQNKQCFKNQYARYRFGGLYLPESELQSENIADNGAIQIAYAAYNQWLQEATNTTTTDTKLSLEFLPKMDLTNKQLFFLAFSQIWCSDVHFLFKQQVSLVDVHAPAKFRVIGPLSNFEAFAQEFKCPSGSEMNPLNKCQLY